MLQAGDMLVLRLQHSLSFICKFYWSLVINPLYSYTRDIAKLRLINGQFLISLRSGAMYSAESTGELDGLKINSMSLPRNKISGYLCSRRLHMLPAELVLPRFGRLLKQKTLYLREKLASLLNTDEPKLFRDDWEDCFARLRFRLNRSPQAHWLIIPTIRHIPGFLILSVRDSDGIDLVYW